MKLGYLTEYTPEEVALAAGLKFDSLEIGVAFNTDEQTVALEEKTGEARENLSKHKIAVSALACYGNFLAIGDDIMVKLFSKAAAVARSLGTNVITTMAGRLADKNIDENMPRLKALWSKVAKVGEDQGIKIAFEPWPGVVNGHGPYLLFNSASTPELWSRIFNEVRSDVLGIEYDPSHLIWQQIDYLHAIRDFGPRIYHMHAKDTLIDQTRLKKCGVLGGNWWRFTIPGEGNVDWPGVFGTLKQVNYQGDIAIEHEDANYTGEKRVPGLSKARDFLRPFTDKQG